MPIIGMFCHDLPIYKDINGNYCSTTLTDALFERYFTVVDKLIVATRIYELEVSYEVAHQELITLANIEYLELPNLNKPQYVFSRIPKAKKKLREAIEKSDMIFIRGGIIAMLAARQCMCLKKDYLVESAGCAWDEYWNHSITGKIIAPYMEIQAKRAIKNAEFVVYVTEKWLQNRYPTKGESTYASNVILEEIDEKALTERIEKIKRRKKEDVWVWGTTAGVNNKAKGQQFVIEAISRLKEKHNIRYELVGVGDTNYLKSVARKYNVEDNVVFKGELSHVEVLSWLDTIDTYIQPSMQEGLPRSLIEAMSRGCPAIGSTTAGIPELLEEEMIFKRGNVKSLVDVIKKCNEIDWEKMAVRNFTKAKEYQLDLISKRRNELYKKYRDYVCQEKKK